MHASHLLYAYPLSLGVGLDGHDLDAVWSISAGLVELAELDTVGGLVGPAELDADSPLRLRS